LFVTKINGWICGTYSGVAGLNTTKSFQSKPKFDDCDYISFNYGLDGSRAKLHGIYRVGKRSASASMPFPADIPYKDWHQADTIRTDAG